MREVIFNSGLFRRFAGFSLIGVINTAVHVLTVMGLVELFGLHPVFGNCLAYVAANMFSFYANSRWNYRTPMAASRYRRFLIVSLGGLGVTASLSGLADVMGWHYLIGTAMVFVVLPGLTFMAHHWWTWGE